MNVRLKPNVPRPTPAVTAEVTSPAPNMPVPGHIPPDNAVHAAEPCRAPRLSPTPIWLGKRDWSAHLASASFGCVAPSRAVGCPGSYVLEH